MSAALLFNCLVGADKQVGGHLGSERFGGLDVDPQLKLRRLLDWQFRRLRAFQDAADIQAGESE